MTIVPLLAALGILLIYRGLTYGGRPIDAAPTWLRRLGIESSAPRVRRITLISGFFLVCVTAFVAGLTQSLLLAVMAGVVAALVPIAMARRSTRRERRRVREAWPDAISTLISSVRAGISLPEACIAIVERGPGTLADAFEDFAATYRATGSFQTALRRLGDTLEDPVADRVVVVLGMAHEVGGTELVRVLRTLVDFIRNDLATRKEIEARWSWAVSAARIAVAAPWLVLMMMWTRPEAASAYRSPGGQLVIAIGAVTTFFGYRLMLTAARLPEERRLGR